MAAKPHRRIIQFQSFNCLRKSKAVLKMQRSSDWPSGRKRIVRLLFSAVLAALVCGRIAAQGTYPQPAVPDSTAQTAAPGSENTAMAADAGNTQAPAQANGNPLPEAESAGPRMVPARSEEVQHGNTGEKAVPHTRLAAPAEETNQDQPKQIQRASPYGDLPSLHDLYTQIPSAGGKMHRFGSEAFLIGTENANELPT